VKKVESSLDYLRKLFIMPDSPDKFMEFGHAVLQGCAPRDQRQGYCSFC
jgi:hypothetical protein